MKGLRLAVALAMTAVPLAAASAATLTVQVENVSPKGGIVSLALFQAANYRDDDHPTLSRDVEAVSPTTKITLTGLKPGTYAIKMMQDINRNGKFDTTWIGIPEEPYGFSNNAEPSLGEPPFSRTRFAVGEGETTIAIRLSGTDRVDPQTHRTAAR